MENTNTTSVESTSVEQTSTEQSNVQQTKGDYFGLHQRKSNLKTEIIAGIIIFMSMFYIIPVQGVMMATGDMIYNGTFEAGPDPVMIASIGIITALAAGLISILMGAFAKHPAALASGMGVNAFVAFTLMAGGMSYTAALSAVLMSGVIFMIVSVTPVRGKILTAIPDDLKKAISIGVGLFLMFVALTNGGLIGNMGNNPDAGTPTSLGKLSDPFVLLTVITIFVTLTLWLLEVPGAVLIGMGISIVIGLFFNAIPGWDVSITDTSGGALYLPSLNFDWSTYGESFSSLDKYMGQAFVGLGDVDQTWSNPTWYLAIFILFLNDFFDTAGTLFGLNSAMEAEGVVIDEKTNKRVLIVDAIGTTAGAVLGTTNVTTFAETASGVQYGGRTGITSITTGVLFLLSIPFIPLLTPFFTSSVTAGAIVLIGIMMASQLKDINADDKVMLTSSIFTIMFMILGYSIGTGIVIGLLTFIVLMLVTGRLKELDWILIASSPMFLAFLVLPLIV